MQSTTENYDVESEKALQNEEGGGISEKQGFLNNQISRILAKLNKYQDAKNTDSSHYWLFLCAVGVHLLLLSACIDLYFASPLEHGMIPVKSTDNPPAKRVVLFVADGLRADAIYGEKTEQRAPFLTNIRKKQGSWGISHTRVPTESRPGHVAMLGGIYEDPSAIFKGWTANPVKFDSVINQSTEAWSWGSPDIVKVFNKENGSYLHQFYYNADKEDFGNANSQLLDEWVFHEVKSFLKIEVKNASVYRQDKGTFFFLHLLGIDTAGHSSKPHSEKYINNIQFVDKGIKDVAKLFQDTFKDNKTAFVFTSDHGMTDWGSHGAGSQPETESPIIAWGAGIKINNTRQDINQINIAPLLASLTGINIPVNSLGILPQNYVNVQEENLAKMQLNNILQLLEILRVKQKKLKTMLFLLLPTSDLRLVRFKRKWKI